MNIFNRKVPFTATHYCFSKGIFIRIGKHVYAEVLINGKWVESRLIKNECLLNDLSAKYTKFFKTGVARDFCNIRLFCIGSSYRIK